MRSARITIRASGQLCQNHLILKEAATHSGRGYDVGVVTIAQHSNFETYDTEILRSATFLKIALERVSTRHAIRLFAFSERALLFGSSRFAVGEGLKSS